MDIFGLVSRSIAQLPPGPHVAGLQAVMKHIEVASKYLERGRDTGENDLYTDVIFRTNHAFEGSLKEAYRVLANADPARKTPNDIEKYLEKNGLLSDRVVIQLTRYRQEWRNPSTHDYTLDFDESEAFLALVSVASFAKLLVDQIAISLAQQNASQKATSEPSESGLMWYLQEECVYLLNSVADQGTPPKSEVELIGLISGYFANIEGLSFQIEPVIGDERKFRPDLIFRRADETVVVELKRSSNPLTMVPTDYNQIEAYTEALPDAEGMLIMWNTSASNYEACSWPPDFQHSDRLSVILFNDIADE